MKKLLIIPFTIIASVALFGPMASANTMQVTMNNGNRQPSPGGEFNASSADFDPGTMGYAASTTFHVAGATNTGFETFCVETNEFINPGSTYYYGISQNAINGGVGGGHPDPISQGTAWLYLNFAQGSLSGYHYTTGSLGNQSAGDLQATIWWLEGETSINPNNTFSMAVVTQFGSARTP